MPIIDIKIARGTLPVTAPNTMPERDVAVLAVVARCPDLLGAGA